MSEQPDTETVHVLLGKMNYENPKIIGIYASAEGAEEQKGKIAGEFYPYDHLRIDEYDVQP